MNRPLTRADKAHDGSIWNVCWAGEDTIVTGSVDETAKIWNVRDEKLEEQHILKHHLGVLSASIDHTGSRLVTTAMDFKVRLWDLSSAALLGEIDGGPGQVWKSICSRTAPLVASASSKGINIWNLDSRDLTSKLESRAKFSMSVAFSSDSRLVACGDSSGKVTVFDVEGERVVHAYETHAKPVRALAFSRDNSVLLSGSDDMQINLHDLSHGQQVASISGHTSWVLGLATNDASNTLASCGSDKRVKLWDLGTRQCLHTFDIHNEQVWSVAFDQSGRKLISGGEDSILQLYAVEAV